MNIKLQQKAATPTKQNINTIANWLMVFAHPLEKTINKESRFPYQTQLLNRRKQLSLKEADKSPVIIDLPNEKLSHVAFAAIETTMSSFELLTLARKMVAAHSSSNPTQLGIVVSGFNVTESERIAEALISAALAAAATMPTFKSDKQTALRLKKLSLFGVQARHGFKQSFAIAEGNALTRSLSMLPSNKLTPTEYLKEIKVLARENKWKLEFYDEKVLKKKKAGAFLSVSQGSPKADAGIVRLRYTPKNAKGKKVFLVGKGICYDTGGTNLKPANYMFGMHEDMQGSAVALGTLLALSKLNFNRPVECWMALAMNHIGPKAYKPNDVITASDGTTIEVVHTDAEGRMVLSDTLALASKEKPSLILDFATLTGGCMYSIGTSYSGVFTNKKEWHADLIKAGEDSGERVWPFPLDEDFDEMIKSDIADVKQCSQESGVDHILASRFLQRFVKNDTPWVHMDLSSSNKKGGLAHIPTDTIGFGVRYSVNLLRNNYLK
jgi:leucyl aminopeptidase